MFSGANSCGIGGSVGEPLSDALQRRRGVRSGWHRTRGVDG